MTPREPDEQAWEEASDERAEPVEVDPTGLDLAKQIAASVARTTPLPPPNAGRQKPKRAGAGRRRGRPGRKDGKADPMLLGEALENVIADRGWGNEVNVHLLLGRWSELVGPTVAEHSHPEAFSKGVVLVRTDSTAWASQLRLMAPQILARLCDAVGDGVVRRVEVKGPDAPSWSHGPRTVRGGRGPRDTYG